MKLIATFLAALVLGSVAMGSAPMNHPSTTPEIPDNWTELAIVEASEVKLNFEPIYDKNYSAEFARANKALILPDSAPSPSPTDFLYQWSGDRKYSVASRVVLPDFRGWKGVDGVALVGYRLEANESIPVFGAGLEYPRQFTLAGDLKLVAKVGFGMLFEQGQSLDRGQLRFYFGGGIRY